MQIFVSRSNGDQMSSCLKTGQLLPLHYHESVCELIYKPEALIE